MTKAARIAGVGILVGIGMVGILRGDDAVPAKLPFTVSKETTGITSPPREDGTPDYVAAMNEKYGKGVKPEENAFVAWLEVVGKGERVMEPKLADRVVAMCGAKVSEGWRVGTFAEYMKDRMPKENAQQIELQGWVLGGNMRKAQKELWQPEEFPEVAEYLKSQGEYLDGVKKAFERRHYWMPYVSGDGRTMKGEWMSPMLMRMRDSADALGARATLRAKAGDFAGFLSDVKAIRRMGQYLASAGYSIERNEGMWSEWMVDEIVGMVAGSGNLTESQSVALWNTLKDFAPPPSRAETLEGCERWQMLNRAMLVATGRGEMLTQAVKFPYDDADSRARKFPCDDVDVAAVDWDVLLKRMNADLEEWLVAVKKPTVEEMEEAMAGLKKNRQSVEQVINNGLARGDGESREAYTVRVGAAMVAMFGPDLERTEEWSRRTAMEDEMARALVAAAGYRAVKGKWPAKLGELVPEYLKEVPRDNYSEGGREEIGFKAAGDGVEVTSIGFKAAGKRWGFKMGGK